MRAEIRHNLSQRFQSGLFQLGMLLVRFVFGSIIRLVELCEAPGKRAQLRLLRERFEASTRDGARAVRDVEHYPEQALDIMGELAGKYGEGESQARFAEAKQRIETMRAESDALQQIRKVAADDVSAAQAYRDYVAAHGESRLGYLYLAGTLSKCGVHQSALKAYEEALRLSERTTDKIMVQIQIGRELDASGDVDRAIAHFRSLLSEPDRDAARFLPAVQLYLGNSLLKSGDTKAARAAWKKAARTDRAGAVAKEVGQMLRQHCE